MAELSVCLLIARDEQKRLPCERIPRLRGALTRSARGQTFTHMALRHGFNGQCFELGTPRWGTRNWAQAKI